MAQATVTGVADTESLFLILGSNRLEDIRDTRSLEAVYKAGQRFDPHSLLAVSRWSSVV